MAIYVRSPRRQRGPSSTHQRSWFAFNVHTHSFVPPQDPSEPACRSHKDRDPPPVQLEAEPPAVADRPFTRSVGNRPIGWRPSAVRVPCSPPPETFRGHRTPALGAELSATPRRRSVRRLLRSVARRQRVTERCSCVVKGRARLDKTEMGHSMSEGRLLVGHGPRCGEPEVDISFAEQPRGRRWPVRGSEPPAGCVSLRRVGGGA